MAEVKITALPAYSDPVSTDVLPIVDVTADLTKKVSITDLLKNAATGSETAPAFAFDADPDTGMYRRLADELAFSTGGTGRLFIDSSGNVGVGTATVSTKLVVAGSNNGSTNNNTLRFVDTDTSSSATQESGRIEFFTSDSTQSGVHSYIAGQTFDTLGNGGLTFGTGTAGSATEAVRIDSSGNVGIGTSNPSALLDINDSGVTDNAWNTLAKFRPDLSDANAETSIHIQSYPSTTVVEDRKAGIQSIDDSGNARPLLLNKDGGNVGIGTSSPTEKIHATGNAILQANNSYIGLENAAGTSTGYIQGQSSFLAIAGGSGSSNEIAFYPASTEAMRIDSSGRLLVGSSSSIAPDGTNNPALQVNRSQSSALNASILIREEETSTSFPRLILNKNRGNNPMQTDNTLGAVDFYGDDGSSEEIGARIQAAAAGNWSTTSCPTDVFFSTTASGATSPSERMRIDGSGNVGIGTSSPGGNLTVTDASTYTLDFKANGSDGALITTLGGSASFAFGTDNTERMRIDSSGNVGIGGAGTNGKFYVSGSGSSGVLDQTFYMDAGGSFPVQIALANGYGAKQGITFLNNGSSSYTSFGIISENTGLSFKTAAYNVGNGSDLATGWTERMRIDSSGRLLVGTSTARTDFFNGGSAVPIQVEGTGTSSAGISIVSNPGADAGNTAVLALGKTRGSSVGGTTIVASGDELGVLTFQGCDGTDLVEGARITAVVDGTPGANDMPGRLVFSTAADSASSPTERMRIDKNGNITNCVGIYNNTTAAAANVFVGSAGDLGRSTSSAKYKTDIESIEDSYSDALLNCRPVWYRSTCEGDNPAHGWWGFIAEEVAAIDPRLVHWKTVEITYDENGSAVRTPCDPEPEGVAYDRFVPHLLNLIKRQQAAIETLEQRLTDAGL